MSTNRVQAATIRKAMILVALATAVGAQSVALEFNAPVPGTLADSSGQGVGFTTRLPGTGGSLPANDPNWVLGGGELALTTTPQNMNTLFNLGNLEAPCLTWSGPACRDFTVTLRILNVQLLNQSDQMGIIVGTDFNNFVRYIAHQSNQFIVEERIPSGPSTGGYNNGTASGLFANGDTIVLTTTRVAGLWYFSWLVEGTATTGTMGPASFPWGNDLSLSIGLIAFNTACCPPFIGHFDRFEIMEAAVLPAPTPLGINGPNTVVWPVSAGGNGHAYEPVSATCGISWYAAHAAALAAGGHLVAITSGPENDFVFALTNAPAYWQPGSNLGPWIGAFEAQTSGVEPGWRWVTGEPFTSFIVGGCGAPNNSCNSTPPTPEDYACFCGPFVASTFPLPATYSGWNDLPANGCGAGQLPWAFVVEYEPTLPCTPPIGSAFTLCAAHDAAGNARVQLFNLPAGSFTGRLLVSTFPTNPVGTGAFFGLNADLVTLSILLALPYPGNPLAWVATEPGIHPEAPFYFAPGLMLQFAGLTWDLMAVAVTGAGGIHLSNVVQNTW